MSVLIGLEESNQVSSRTCEHRSLREKAGPAAFCSVYEHVGGETALAGSTSGLQGGPNSLVQRVVRWRVLIFYSYLPGCPVWHNEVLNLKKLWAPVKSKNLASFAALHKAAVPRLKETY